MKFGKYLEARQLELPEYNSHFIDYKSLKKLIKQLAVPLSQVPSSDHTNLDDIDEATIYERLQENKASFFFKLERELEKVNSYYVEKEADLRIKFDILESKYRAYKNRSQLTSKQSVSYKNIHAGFKKFQKDLTNFEQYIQLNRTGFSKVLKKWDKRSHSHQKEFYLATVVSVQPIFTSNEVSKLNDGTSNILMQLDDVSNDETSTYYSNDRSVSNSAIFGTSPGDTLMKISLCHPSSQTVESIDPGSSAFINTDIEIENWYMEIVNISKLRDDHKKFGLLREFYSTKIEKAINETIPQSRIDKNLILKECLTKLFLLLVSSSSVDDISLHVFYNTTKENIDLSYCDEDDQVFSRRNVFHEAANCSSQSRIFVIREASLGTTVQSSTWSSLTRDTLKSLLNAQDLYLRTPLHYAAELGKVEFVSLLLDSGMLDSVDILDNHSQTPLVLAIINNHIEVVRKLLIDGHATPFPQINEYSKPQFAPLIIACYHNNYDVAKLILEMGGAELSEVHDAEGLGTLHIVAKEGGNAQLIELLVRHGADPNGVDNFNTWTPIFYAIQEGHADTVQELLKNGARLDITDEDNLGPIYYAIWEGHVTVLNVLLHNISAENENRHTNISATPIRLTISERMSPTSSLQDIPDFALPPPIIPLLKYGHNFLEKKIFVKLTLKTGGASVQLNKDDEMILSAPGRITLTSNLADVIPRNIILPIAEEEEGEVVFQIDTTEDFSIDFEVFPAFGTRIIAKTTAMSSVFNSRLANGTATATASLPLFDARLTNVGTLSFDYQVILPYSGKPLEVTKYETYWKSTTSSNIDLAKDGHQIVTSSSLCGSFVNIMVCPLIDGTLVAAPCLYFNTHDVKMFLSDLTKEKLEKLCGYKLNVVPDIADKEELKKHLSSSIFIFSDLLKKIPLSVQLEIQVCFPTTQEITGIPVNICPFLDINEFIDRILLSTFEHVRDLRHSGQHIRPIVFSSCNWQACTILNWKQPNFPVLFHMKGLRKEGNHFVRDTPHSLKDLAIDEKRIDFSDNKSRCLHEIVRFAVNNNLLGIIIPYDLLKICKPLISSIREHGLFLIGSCERNDEEALSDDNINGFHVDSELNFTGNVDM